MRARDRAGLVRLVRGNFDDLRIRREACKAVGLTFRMVADAPEDVYEHAQARRDGSLLGELRAATFDPQAYVKASRVGYVRWRPDRAPAAGLGYEGAAYGN